MSRYNPHHDAKPILAAAAEWADKCLQHDGSILSDDQNLWTTEHLNELDQLFVQNLDEGERTFLEKLEDQIRPGSPESRRLMAEALWILMLFQSNIRAETKRTNVQTVWAWSGTELDSHHPMLSDDILGGLGSTGAAFNTQRWRELSFLLTLTRAFKRLGLDDRKARLSDAWQFAGWLQGFPEARNRQFRHIWLHLLFPDEFERISSSGDKKLIVAAFNNVQERDVRTWDNERIDRALLDVRHRLERESAAPLDFYQDEALERWRETARTWLLSWNPQKWDWASLQEDRASAVGGRPVIHAWRCASSKPKEGDHAYLVRTGVPPKGIIAYGTIVKAPYEAPHFDPAKAQAGEMAPYVDVEFSGVRDAERDDIVPLDELDRRRPEQTWNPQSSGIQIASPAARVLAGLWRALSPVQGGDAANSPMVSSAVLASSSAPPRNVILYGPPGTGKTHRLRTGFLPAYEDRTAPATPIRRYEFVTFHQSYAYEDFVEGIRPKIEAGGTVTYEVKPGVFRRLCERAKKDPAHRYAIFIDEINRGNVAKVFGELITLLEPDKRASYDATGLWLSDLEVTLPYSGERFSVPSNLDVYGTMNTADRSIALLDLALRRRFEFEELVPTPDTLTGADGQGVIPDDDGGEINLRLLLATLNRRITHLLHRDQTIGHAYLMKVKDFTALRRVLSREIIPLLQEYFYEDWQRIRLVLGDHPKLAAEHQLIRRSVVVAKDLFPDSEDDLTEAAHYVVTPEADITADSVRKIYELQG
jgi:5-methylcytosine-specific restriction protein B